MNPCVFNHKIVDSRHTWFTNVTLWCHIKMIDISYESYQNEWDIMQINDTSKWITYHANELHIISNGVSYKWMTHQSWRHIWSYRNQIYRDHIHRNHIYRNHIYMNDTYVNHIYMDHMYMWCFIYMNYMSHTGITHIWIKYIGITHRWITYTRIACFM